jgi:hypothetical protein
MWCLALAALLASGCRDGGTEAAPDAAPPVGPAFAASSHALQALGPGWRTDATEPHGCFVSVAARTGSIAYLYKRLPLRLPDAARPRDGAVTAFRYRVVTTDGRVVGVVNCVIPATGEAWRMVARRFGVPSGEEAGSVMMASGGGCVINNGEHNPCILEPVEVTVKPEDFDPCSDFDMYCEPDPGTGVPAGGPASCANCGPTAPVASCNAAVRGSFARCTVNVGDASVASWLWGDGTSLVQGPANRADWSGTAVASGEVSVRLADGTVLQTEMNVADRGWTWGTRGASRFSDGTGEPCYTGLPDFTHPNGWNMGLHVPAACAPGEDELVIQPDSYGGPDANGPTDGFTIETVGGGPNAGLRYVKTAALYIRRKSAYNPQIEAAAAQVELNGWNRGKCGMDRANWYQFNTCMGVNVDDYIAGLHAHEGHGRNGGYGHYSAALFYVQQPANDPMIFLDQEVSAAGESGSDFLTRLRQEFIERARKVDGGARPNAQDGGITGGNWSGSSYRWNDATRTFELATSSI